MKRILKILNSLEEWTLVIMLLGLAFLTFIQVVSRYLFHYSFTWMDELARYLGVFIAFLGASLGVKYGGHFSMDLIYERVSNDRFRHGAKVLVGLISAMVFFVVAVYGWEQAMKLRQYGVTTSALRLPKYWAYLPIPFFSVFIGLRFLNLSAEHFKAFLANEPFGKSQEQEE